MTRLHVLLVATLLVAWSAGCAQLEEAEEPDTEPADDFLDTDEGMGAPTRLLAEARLEALPADAVRWIAWIWSEVPEAHEAAPGFAYAASGTHQVGIDGESHDLMEGEAVFLPAGATPVTSEADGLWRIVLAHADATHEGARFHSETLDGIPSMPVDARFLVVTLEPGGMTAVHMHPGSEFIHVHEGRIEYETAVSPAEMLDTGGSRTLDADTAVQKRNPFDGPAAFLSLFLVDPERPFVEEASFD